MATPKIARVVAGEMLSADTRLLELVAEEPLGFVGGQYVIVDSGLVAESGKAIKRAYSLLGGDQRRFRLVVKRIGPGSGYLHDVAIGSEVRFSGPWGKFYPQRDAPTLVLATDTGITAALALVESRRCEVRAFLWLRTRPDYFLPDALVGEAEIRTIPAIGDPQRIACARAVLESVLAREPIAQAFISGDGAVNYALLEDLVAAGIPATRDNLESFFNMPKKSS